MLNVDCGFKTISIVIVAYSSTHTYTAIHYSFMQRAVSRQPISFLKSNVKLSLMCDVCECRYRYVGVGSWNCCIYNYNNATMNDNDNSVFIII